MWTTLSSGRWIFLFSVIVVMSFSTSEGNSFVAPDCCFNVSRAWITDIKECYEQVENETCKIHAFLIVRETGKKACLSPDIKWLNNKIRKGHLCCKRF